MQTATRYRGVFTATRTATGSDVTYVVTDATTGAQIMSHSFAHVGSIASFDTVDGSDVQ